VLFLDCEKTYNKIVTSTKAYFNNAGFSKAVIGLSGGLDSSLTAFVLVDALGKENVTGLFLPENGESKNQDHADALAVAKSLGNAFEEISIEKIVKSIEQSVKWNQNKIAEMNLRARARMLLLYNFANSLNALVVGTSNKSELMLGYFTKHGDGAADVLPLQNIFKTDIFAIAKIKGLPANIIEKQPSAGLAPNQTDAKELGAQYSEIDPVLDAIEQGKSAEELKNEFDAGLVDSLLKKIAANKHKQTEGCQCLP